MPNQSLASAWVSNVQFFSSVTEQEVGLGLLRKQQTGVVVVARSIAVDIKTLRVAIGEDDFSRPKHVARRHEVQQVDATALALIKLRESALC